MSEQESEQESRSGWVEVKATQAHADVSVVRREAIVRVRRTTSGVVEVQAIGSAEWLEPLDGSEFARLLG